MSDAYGGLLLIAADRAPAGPTVQEIDAELAQLAADQAETTDPQIAGAIEQQRLALEADRRIVAAVAAAQQRRAAAEQTRHVHAEFERLQADLAPALRARAVALDEWVEQGAALVAAYGTTLQRLAALHDLDLTPVGDLQLPDLMLKRHRLAVQAPLAVSLARAGVIEGDGREARTIEALTTTNLAEVFRYVRSRLPPVAAARAAGGDGDDRAT